MGVTSQRIVAGYHAENGQCVRNPKLLTPPNVDTTQLIAAKKSGSLQALQEQQWSIMKAAIIELILKFKRYYIITSIS